MLLEHAFNINLHREDETGETEEQVRKIVFSIGVDTVVILSCQDYCLMTLDFFFFSSRKLGPKLCTPLPLSH